MNIKKYFSTRLSMLMSGGKNQSKDSEMSDKSEHPEILFANEFSITNESETTTREKVLLETFLIEKIGEAYLLSLPDTMLPILTKHGSEEHVLHTKKIFARNNDILECVLKTSDPEVAKAICDLTDNNNAVLSRLMRSANTRVAIQAINIASESDKSLVQELKQDYLKKMQDFETVNPSILDHIKISLRK